MSGNHLHILLGEDDDDPMLSAINLVDVFLVLVVALLLAVAMREQAAQPSAAAVQRAGEPDMEIVLREQGREVLLKGDGRRAPGDGVRAGVAYRLKDGSVVYVPEATAAEGRGAR